MVHAMQGMELFVGWCHVGYGTVEGMLLLRIGCCAEQVDA